MPRIEDRAILDLLDEYRKVDRWGYLQCDSCGTHEGILIGPVKGQGEVVNRCLTCRTKDKESINVPND